MRNFIAFFKAAVSDPLSRRVHDFIAVLRRRRESLGWSQLELSLRMGYTGHTVIGNWETGEKTPTIASAIHWADALGLTLAATPRDDHR